MSEMFSLGTNQDIDECPAVQLKAGIPVAPSSSTLAEDSGKI